MQLPIRPIVLVIIIISLLSAGCASLPEDVERKPSYALADTDETILGMVTQPLTEAHAGKSGFHLLRQGINAFAARLLLVGAAERSLDLQYYIWHDDLTGRVLQNRVLDAADRGVRVRLLLDDLDTAGKEQMLPIVDAHPNIEVRLYNPFANRHRRVGDFVSDLSRVDHRMHNKTLTADNQAAILGGRNIGDEYFDASEEVGFNDLDVLAIGPVVKEVTSQFDLYWNSEWVYPLSAFEPDEPITNEQIVTFRKKSDSYLEEGRNSAYGVAFENLDIVNDKAMADLEFEWGDWQLMYDHPSKVVDEEVTAATHLAPNLREAVFKAQSDLVIVSAYFILHTGSPIYAKTG
ncbi:MAG: phospholipase D-like domain-containing protein [Chromatiales bacterium]|jgi:putative cardiolipin synthase